jgi:hypothetical protein
MRTHTGYWRQEGKPPREIGGRWSAAAVWEQGGAGGAEADDVDQSAAERGHAARQAEAAEFVIHGGKLICRTRPLGLDRLNDYQVFKASDGRAALSTLCHVTAPEVGGDCGADCLA